MGKAPEKYDSAEEEENGAIFKAKVSDDSFKRCFYVKSLELNGLFFSSFQMNIAREYFVLSEQFRSFIHKLPNWVGSTDHEIVVFLLMFAWTFDCSIILVKVAGELFLSKNRAELGKVLAEFKGGRVSSTGRGQRIWWS